MATADRRAVKIFHVGAILAADSHGHSLSWIDKRGKGWSLIVPMQQKQDIIHYERRGGNRVDRTSIRWA